MDQKVKPNLVNCRFTYYLQFPKPNQKQLESQIPRTPGAPAYAVDLYFAPYLWLRAGRSGFKLTIPETK